MSRASFELHAGGADAIEVTVTGEVDASNVVDFSHAVHDLAGPRPIILVLSRMKYLDSAAFSALDRLLAQDEIVIVLAPDSFMYRVADLMCIPIHHDVASARQALREK